MEDNQTQSKSLYKFLTPGWRFTTLVLAFFVTFLIGQVTYSASQDNRSSLKPFKCAQILQISGNTTHSTNLNGSFDSSNNLEVDYQLVIEKRGNPRQVVTDSDFSAIEVTSGTNVITYARTERGLEQLSASYSDGISSYLGKKVLDVGTGNGATVRQLRKMGINAFGLDIHLNQNQKQSALFIESSIDQTTLAPSQFDLILSSFSAMYYRKADLNFLHLALVELSRILKVGGEIRIEPTSRNSIETVMKQIAKS